MKHAKLLVELQIAAEDYRKRQVTESRLKSCLCQRAGQSTEDCPWKCPTWLEDVASLGKAAAS